MVKEPKRTDIIKEYIAYYHEYICSTLTEYWDKKHDNFGGVILKTNTFFLH